MIQFKCHTIIAAEYYFMVVANMVHCQAITTTSAMHYPDAIHAHVALAVSNSGLGNRSLATTIIAFVVGIGNHRRKLWMDAKMEIANFLPLGSMDQKGIPSVWEHTCTDSIWWRCNNCNRIDGKYRKLYRYIAEDWLALLLQLHLLRSLYLLSYCKITKWQ